VRVSVPLDGGLHAGIEAYEEADEVWCNDIWEGFEVGVGGGGGVACWLARSSCRGDGVLASRGTGFALQG
jgi:hypothetical protein